MGAALSPRARWLGAVAWQGSYDLNLGELPQIVPAGYSTWPQPHCGRH